MEFIVAEVVRLFPVAQPGQFQLMTAAAVFQINDDETAVLGVDPPDFLHIESFGIEFEAFFEVEHVEIVVNHLELHDCGLLFIWESAENL